ncbi:MAG: leucine-rich repeat domain-containing protein [Acholeplasmatales bacterium]|nr:leucine-rich repeat domain-containing protein [Acholeplasmatales bacterium]
MNRRTLFIRMLIPFSVMVICILITLFSFKYSPRLTYKWNSEYEGYVVNNAYGNAKSYTVREEYNGKPVVGIGLRAFYKHSNLESIEFENPENIIFIDRFAFSECTKLKTIDLEYVDYIERNAFSYCYKLNNIKLGLKDLLGSVFYKCTSLDTIDLGDTLRTIGTFAFSYTSFTELTLPKSMNTIYTNAFKYSNLKKVYAFYGLNVNNIISNDIEVEFYS